MSCEVKLCANICDIDRVRRGLYPLDDARGTCNQSFNLTLNILPRFGELVITVRNIDISDRRHCRIHSRETGRRTVEKVGSQQLLELLQGDLRGDDKRRR